MRRPFHHEQHVHVRRNRFLRHVHHEERKRACRHQLHRLQHARRGPVEEGRRFRRILRWQLHPFRREHRCREQRERNTGRRVEYLYEPCGEHIRGQHQVHLPERLRRVVQQLEPQHERRVYRGGQFLRGRRVGFFHDALGNHLRRQRHAFRRFHLGKRLHLRWGPRRFRRPGNGEQGSVSREFHYVGRVALFY